jgi:hypothetical protein
VSGRSAAWLAHLLGVQEVVGSNPAAPTKKIEVIVSSKGLVAFVASSLCLGACASGPALDRYSTREIDRPYTLPEGVAAWGILSQFTLTSTSPGSPLLSGSTNPANWVSSLSDDWSLLWTPLPLGVSHQFFNSEQHRFGMTFVAGGGYGSYSGFFFSPTVSASYRYRFSKNGSIDVTPLFNMDIPASGVARWSTNLYLGPTFQLSDVFALSPALSLEYTNSVVGPASSSGIGWGTSGRGWWQDSMDFLAGVQVSAVWRFAKQWDHKPMIGCSGFGSRTGYQESFVNLSFIHYW